MIKQLVFASVLFTASCAGDSGSDDTLNAEESLTAHTSSIDLISTATCTLSSGRLRQCQIAQRSVSAAPTSPAVPVRTVVRKTLTGNCATQFPLAVSISSTDLREAHTFSFLSDPPAILRTGSGEPLEQLVIADASAWTRTATFDASCTVRLDIDFNVPDIDTRLQAEAALAKIDLDILAAGQSKQAYQDLLLFHSAYVFLRSVANDLHQEVNGEMMQRLRIAYDESRDAFDALNESDACQADLGQSLADIFEVADSLFVLGDPDDWINSEGAPMTLADLYSQFRDDGVIVRIEQMAANADPNLESHYQQLYEAATLEHISLQQQRQQAVSELRPWLESVP